MSLIIIIVILLLIVVIGRNVRQRRESSKSQPTPPVSGEPAPTPIPGQETLFNAGLQLVDFDFFNSITNKNEVITAAVWYPSNSEPQPFVYHDAEDYQSIVAFNGSLAKKESPYPLILFSHGAYGSGYNAAYFMEYLARQGYIAVAPDYIDTKPPEYKEEIAFSRIKEGKSFSNLQVLRVGKEFVEDANADTNFMLSYVEKHRLNHASFIIDKMLGFNRDPSSFFNQAIDEKSIGMMGHSLGGLTTLAKVGAYPKPGFTDERAKAALLFSAPAHPFEESMKQIDIPIMMMIGDNDEPAYGPKDVPRYIIYDSALPPKYLLILNNATHFTFGNSGCGKTPFYQAVQTVPQTRAISQYGLAFFDKYLKNDSSANEQLNKADSSLAYYIKEEKSGDVSEWGTKPPASQRGFRGGILEEILKRRSR